MALPIVSFGCLQNRMKMAASQKLAKRAAVTILTVALISIIVANFHRAYVLRWEDATDLRVIFKPALSCVVISGGMTHSGMTVVGSTVQRVGRRVISRVYIDAISGSSGIGSYNVVVPVPADVTEVWFGDVPGWRTVGSLFGFKIRMPQIAPRNFIGKVWDRIP